MHILDVSTNVFVKASNRSKLKDFANENPLFQNYIVLKEEVQNLLNQLSYLIKKGL